MSFNILYVINEKMSNVVFPFCTQRLVCRQMHDTDKLVGKICFSRQRLLPLQAWKSTSEPT